MQLKNNVNSSSSKYFHFYVSLCSATSRNVWKSQILQKNSLRANLLNAFNAERREIIQRGKKADVYSYGTFPTRMICLFRFHCLQKSLWKWCQRWNDFRYRDSPWMITRCWSEFRAISITNASLIGDRQFRSWLWAFTAFVMIQRSFISKAKF